MLFITIALAAATSRGLLRHTRRVEPIAAEGPVNPNWRGDVPEDHWPGPGPDPNKVPALQGTNCRLMPTCFRAELKCTCHRQQCQGGLSPIHFALKPLTNTSLLLGCKCCGRDDGWSVNQAPGWHAGLAPTFRIVNTTNATNSSNGTNATPFPPTPPPVWFG